MAWHQKANTLEVSAPLKCRKKQSPLKDIEWVKDGLLFTLVDKISLFDFDTRVKASQFFGLKFDFSVKFDLEGDEWSYGQACDWTHAHRQTQASTIPEGQK